jgi:pilus assembly protein CpaB
LRRVQPIALKAESESSGAPAREAASAGDRRQADRRQAERRQGDRRGGMDALRAEALQQLITRVEDRNFGGLRNQVHWNAGFKNSRIVLIAVAVVAGGMAAYLAVQRPTPAPEAVAPVTEVVAEPRTQILAARETIAIGQRLSPAALEWIEWPESAVRAEFITATATPEAMTEMSGAVARTGFVAGEPILPQKLMSAGEGSYLAALLGTGMRAVSVSVSADSASGGFVSPNDRVDVVLIRPDDAGGQVTRTILQNVRVLAINGRLGPTEPPEPGADAPPQPEVFEGAIATLELDPKAAEVIMSATAHGRLTLVLRAMLDAGDTAAIRSSANQAIRLSSPFWAE